VTVSGLASRWPWATLLLAGSAIVVHGWPAATQGLIFDRTAWATGDWWRAFSGHLVHYSGSHLGWNLAVLLPAGIWSERIAPGPTRLLYAAAWLLIGPALVVLAPALQTYAGLSGLGTAALTLLALLQVHRASGRAKGWWLAVLVLIALKIGAEAATGQTTLASAAIPIRPVPLAHLIGTGLAALAFAGWLRRQRG
jgi:rhomboid family GlyGly-CTERM serine protease